MRQASPALITLLNATPHSALLMADLFTFTLAGGAVLRYSGAATQIIDGTTGRIFALGPRFERTAIKTTVGVEVDDLELSIYPDTTDLIGSTPWLQAAWTGQLDGALLTVERAFMAPSWGDVVGTIVLFAGRVSDMDCTRTGISMKCRSHLELLNIPMPRRLWSGTCTHVFGGPMCLFDRTSLQLTFAAGAGSTQTTIQGAPTSTTPFVLGTAIAVTGANAGQQRTIDAFVSGGSLSVKLAFLSPVAPGDEFTILPGCDHTLATCENVFNNGGPSAVDHFGGFPFIPTPETAA